MGAFALRPTSEPIIAAATESVNSLGGRGDAANDEHDPLVSTRRPIVRASVHFEMSCQPSPFSAKE